MAQVAEGAVVIANRRGMAPPVGFDLGGDRWLFVLPGVPREFSAVLEEELIPHYCAGGSAPVVRELRYPQAIEAEFAATMIELGATFPDVVVGSYPQSQTRELLIRLRGDDSARVAAAEQRMRELRPGAV
jgi:molybdopterin-biosynthesis enzyme MoeA-like protein